MDDNNINIDYINRHIDEICLKKDVYLSKEQKLYLAKDLLDVSDYLVNQLGGGFKGDRVSVECGVEDCTRFSRVWLVKKCTPCGKSFCRQHQNVNCPSCHHGRLY